MKVVKKYVTPVACLLALVVLAAIMSVPGFSNNSDQSVDQQSQLNLGTSVVEFNLIGNGPGTTTVTLSIQTAGSVTFTNGIGQTVTCSPAPDTYLLACGSGSGTGDLFSDSDSAGPAYYYISSPSQTPITLQDNGDGTLTIEQTANLDYTFSSPEGTLTGTISMNGAIWDETAGEASTAVGIFTATGGTFSSLFSNGGDIQLSLSDAADIETIVGTSNTITGQVEFPGTISPSETSTCDFMTGGGWISNSSAAGPGSNPGGGNGKATFAITGGCKHCHGWGHLNYIDHGTGMHVTGEADPSCSIAYNVVSNGPTQSNGQLTGCRQMGGNADINGAPGTTYTVTACDNGEPGTTDTFSITLSNGYTNSGTLGGGTQGGGNIQLHKGNPSFCCTSSK